MSKAIYLLIITFAICQIVSTAAVTRNLQST